MNCPVLLVCAFMASASRIRAAECSGPDATALLQGRATMTLEGDQKTSGNLAKENFTACVVDTCFTPSSLSAKCTLTPLDDGCCDVARIGRLRLSGPERWQLSQNTELDWWKTVAAGDKHAFDSLGHVASAYYNEQYHMVPCNLGDVVELGSGAYTQLRAIFERARNLKQCSGGFQVSSYTAVDPLADTIAKDGLHLGTFQSGKFCVSKQQFWAGGCVPTSRISGEAVNSPLPKNAFNTVIMVNTLSYVPNAGETLTSLHAALRPGGILLIGNEFVANDKECEGYGSQSSHPICLTRAFYQWFFHRFFDVLHYREAKGQFFKMEDAPASLDLAPRLEDCGAGMGLVEKMCTFYAVLRKREKPNTDVQTPL